MSPSPVPLTDMQKHNFYRQTAAKHPYMVPFRCLLGAPDAHEVTLTLLSISEGNSHLNIEKKDKTHCENLAFPCKKHQKTSRNKNNPLMDGELMGS